MSKNYLNEAHYRKEDVLLAYKAYLAIKELEEQRNVELNYE